MRSFILIFFFVSLAGCASAAEPIRLLSYNIHAGVGSDKVLNLERIADVIKESKADIVALQEVDKLTSRSGKRDLAHELSEHTGMEAIFGAAMKYGGGHYGNAFLIRKNSGWHVTSHKTHAIPAPNEKEPRCLLEIQLTSEHTTMRSLTVFSTHWCNSEETNRVASAKFTNELVSKQKGTFILIGDLNATPQSPPLKALLDMGWNNPANKETPTVPVSSPKRQIDYVLIRTDEKWKTAEIKTLNRPEASDHLPLITVIEFP
jgi:endonuclease/exonuclease/phosphatase family metal-dependent hydrolase